MDWQPIETAPKGGGAETVTDPKWIEPPKILLRFGNEAVSVAYWDWYYAEGGHGCTDGFAWIEPCSGEPLNMHFSTPPTEWQPIPEPPAAPCLPPTPRRTEMSETTGRVQLTEVQMRDWFAGQALVALGNWIPPGDYVDDEGRILPDWLPKYHRLVQERRAEYAYQAADAMLAARGAGDE